MTAISERVVVGIDLGQTCTGVSILSTRSVISTREIKPVAIQKWPESKVKVVSKVPTRLTYRAGDLRIHHWGFGCTEREKVGAGTRVIGLFKFMFDRPGLAQYNARNPDSEETLENVYQWFLDFLTKLRNHVVDYLSTSSWNVVWGDTVVEYIFSLPTSWGTGDHSPDLVAAYESVIAQAGFGEGENCSVKVGLTEAIAAALYTARKVNHEFLVGDIVLSCDAGGMTSDICALRVAEVDKDTIMMEALLPSICIFNGSLQIDEAFEKLLQSELDARNVEAGEHAAHNVRTGDFQDVKAIWGTGIAPPNVATFKVPIESYRRERGHQGLEDLPISVRIPKGEIDKMFDAQVDPIISALDGTIDSLAQLYPPLQVSALFLSGGLGSSQYLQEKVISHYQPTSLRVRFDPIRDEAPLSVCQGLVYDRMQEIFYGKSVFRIRRCHASYGLLCDNKSLRTSTSGGGEARRQIKWFIVKGDKITEGKPIVTKRVRETDSGDPDMAWTDTIVMSEYTNDLLPRFLGQGDCKEVAIISSSADRNTLTKKRKHLVGKKFLEGKYEVCVQLDHENLKVETKVSGEVTGECELSQVPWHFTQEF